MNDRVSDVEAQITALLEIVNNNYAQAAKLVCDDIQTKEPKEIDCKELSNGRYGS